MNHVKITSDFYNKNIFWLIIMNATYFDSLRNLTNTNKNFIILKFNTLITRLSLIKKYLSVI